MNASLPSQTRDNGSLYAHIFIYPAGGHPFENQYVSRAVAPLTVYSLPQDESINLLSEQKSKEVSQFKTPKEQLLFTRGGMMIYIFVHFV